MDPHCPSRGPCPIPRKEPLQNENIPPPLLLRLPKMRPHRLVHGDPLHFLKRPAPKRPHIKRHHLPLDVPHLWKCCLSWSPLPPSKKEVGFSTGSSLYASYLYHGAFQWKAAFQKEALPLGLWPFPLEYPPPDPPGLCSLMVFGRSLFRAASYAFLPCSSFHWLSKASL